MNYIITPGDINDLSYASFQAAFRVASTSNPPGSFAIAQAIQARLFNNLNGKVNPNKAELITAVLYRFKNIAWWVAPDDPLFNTALRSRSHPLRRSFRLM